MAAGAQLLRFTCDFDIDIDAGVDVVLTDELTRHQGRIPESTLAIDTTALRRVIEDGLARGGVIDADAPPRVRNIRIRWELRSQSPERT